MIVMLAGLNGWSADLLPHGYSRIDFEAILGREQKAVMVVFAPPHDTIRAGPDLQCVSLNTSDVRDLF